MTGSTIPEELLRTLHAAKRNRYFYAKPLDVAAFQLEQCYGIEQRWLGNRLALGPGVLCGLDVVAGADGTVALRPGVAVDGLGREVVVPSAVVVDPFQPTDAFGRPDGDRLAAGAAITMLLCYLECAADPTAVAVSDCDGGTATQAGATVEKFLVRVVAGLPADRPAALTAEQRDAIFPEAPAADFDRLVATEAALAVSCAPPDQACVVVATATLAAEGTPVSVDQYGYRPGVFSNTVLFELIAALAERVDACCNAVHPPVTRTLQVIGGDAQSGPVGQPLPAPVEVKVVDGAGDGVDGEAVELSVTADATVVDTDAGGAEVATLTVTSHDGGMVRATWRLGSAGGQQALVARLASTGAAAVITATASVEPPPAPPPRVTAIRPANTAMVPDAWAQEPTVTVSFDQKMGAASLENPEGWLRLWRFQRQGGDFVFLNRIKLGLADVGDGATVTFRGEQVNAERFDVLAVMLGSAPEIVADESGTALDAEYQGTRLTADQIAQIWDEDDVQVFQDFIDAVTDGGGMLPSGDGQPGGKFFSSFFRLGPVN